MKENILYLHTCTTSFGIPWRPKASLKGWRGPSVMGRVIRGVVLLGCLNEYLAASAGTATAVAVGPACLPPCRLSWEIHHVNRISRFCLRFSHSCQSPLPFLLSRSPSATPQGKLWVDTKYELQFFPRFVSYCHRNSD